MGQPYARTASFASSHASTVPEAPAWSNRICATSPSFSVRAPIALQFSSHGQPCDRLGSRGDNTADGHVMRFRRDAARSVGNGVHVVAFTHRVNGGLRKTHLRPECSNDKLLAAGVLHGLDDAAILPGVDEAAVDRFLIGKDCLDLPENLTAAFRGDCGENRRDSECPGRLGETRDVVDHHRRLVTVNVCQLRRLVIDQENGAILRRQKRVETDLRECVHDLLLPLKCLVRCLQPLTDKQAARVQRLGGGLDRSDDGDKSVWHARPHVKPGIDTGGDGTFDVSS